MQTFTSEDLQRRPAEVQQSALGEPTFITFHGRPRLVMLSLEEFDRLRARRHIVLNAVSLGDVALDDLERLASQFPSDGTEPSLLGGLLEEPARIQSLPPT